ncbi:MAG: amidohydrolase family protein [Pirellula sp.]|nr:amidohydrolase family protein [Pirellula sp.]
MKTIKIAVCSLVSFWGACNTGMGNDTLAIVGGKIITLAGEPIEKGTIIVRDGKIEAVGADIKVPLEAKVLDITGQVVMPGFIDPHTSEGMGQANERNENVPFLSVVDGIDPVMEFFEECRRSGVTTAAIVPGNSTLIGGHGVVLKTSGQYVNDMIVKRDVGMKISLRPTSGSRMAHISKLRRELEKAKIAVEKKNQPEAEKGDKPAEATGEANNEQKPTEQPGETNAEAPADGAPPPSAAELSRGQDAMMAVVQGKLPVFLYCDTAMDVTTAQSLVKDYSLNATFVLGRNTYKAAELLKGTKQPVVLDPTLIFWETDPRTKKDSKVILTKVFQDAGVPFVFQTSESSARTTSASSYFWYQAAVAVKNGMSEGEALKTLSIVPAKMLGIDEFVGSIEAGKDADLVILTGEPLKLETWVEKTIVRGEVVYDRSQDEKLARLLAPSAD